MYWWLSLLFVNVQQHQGIFLHGLVARLSRRSISPSDFVMRRSTTIQFSGNVEDDSVPPEIGSPYTTRVKMVAESAFLITQAGQQGCGKRWSRSACTSENATTTPTYPFVTLIDWGLMDSRAQDDACSSLWCTPYVPWIAFTAVRPTSICRWHLYRKTPFLFTRHKTGWINTSFLSSLTQSAPCWPDPYSLSMDLTGLPSSIHCLHLFET